MIPLEVIGELYDYGCWAREQQLAVCATLAQEQLIRPLGSSFGSLQDTLRHQAGADWVWLERFQGRSPESFPAPAVRTLEDIRLFWRDVEQRMRAFLGTLAPERLAAPLTYRNFKGITWSYPLWRCLMHAVNHGTYHRGQVAMALRQLGAVPPATDFLVYCDRRDAQTRYQ